MTIPNWQNRTLFHGDNLTFLRANEPPKRLKVDIKGLMRSWERSAK